MSDQHGFINILVQASDPLQTSPGGLSVYYVPLSGNYKITLKNLFVNAGAPGTHFPIELASPQLRNTMGPAQQPYYTAVYPFTDAMKTTLSGEMGFYSSIQSEIQLQFRNYSDHLPMTGFVNAVVLLEYEKL